MASIEEIFALRPAWIEGSISLRDARFLHARVVASSATDVVEIGTASGVSTAIIANALAGREPEFRVTSYDISTHFYANTEYRVGQATAEMLEDGHVSRVRFRNPARAVDVRADFASDSLDFVFIDASHKHPWPVLDFLAVLPCLRPGAEVVMHDINLPLINPAYPDWGAKYLFDGLAQLQRREDPETTPPNIGSVVVPAEKDALRAHLVDLIARHEWEATIVHDVSALLEGR